MAAIIKLSQNEWVKVFSENGGNQSWQVWVSLKGKTNIGWIQVGQIKDEWEWINLSQFILLWVSQSAVRVFLSESERRKQGVWIQQGRIQDGCHHQVESEWMSEVFLCKWWEGKCEWSLFCANGGNQSWQVWVSLRGKTKVAESKMAKFKIAKFKMAAIIKLSENEWVWVRLNKFESEFCAKWLNPRWQNSRWLPSSS